MGDATSRSAPPCSDSFLLVLLHREEPPAGPWHVEPLADFVEDLIDIWPPYRPTVLSIDGRSSSGKTTLARRIANVVSATATVHTDDIAWRHSVFGWADPLIAGVLRPLQAHSDVSYRPPAWETHNRSGSIKVAADTRLLLIEGVGASRRELTSFIDASLWVQSDMTVRLARDSARIKAGETTQADYDAWRAEETAFQAERRPWESATAMVAGSSEIPYDPARQVVVSARPATRPV